MARVYADQLEPADDLWWMWAVLAATHRAFGKHTYDLVDDQCLEFASPGGSWLRMQRFRGDRAVLWGRDVDSEDDALTNRLDVLEPAPDWAQSAAVRRAVHAQDVGFLAWFDEGEWDAATPGLDDGADLILEPLLDIGAIAREVKLAHKETVIDLLPRVLADARARSLTVSVMRTYLGGSGDPAAAHGLLVRALEPAEAVATGTVRDHLRVQVHAQMKDAAELPGRTLPDRPDLLTRWAGITTPAQDFEHAVMVEHGRVVGAHGNQSLPDQLATTLTNLLAQLHHEEASDEWGAWIFARVRYADTVVSLDRIFDSWPDWFSTGRSTRGPSLEGLAWEMQQRSETWRPAWVSLLPPD